MKILLTCGSSDYTGASKMAHSFALALRAAKNEVTCICGSQQETYAGIASRLREDGFEVIEEKSFNYLLDFRLLRRIVRLLRSRKIDCVVSMVQADAKIACFAAWIARVPCVISAQNITKFYGSTPIRILKYLAFTALIHLGATLIVCSGEKVKAQYKRKHFIPNRKTAILANGIDISIYSPGKLLKEKCRRHAWDILMLSVGRIDPQKGQLVLLEGFNQDILKNIAMHLWLVGAETDSSKGTIDYANKVREFIFNSNLSDRVSLLGWRDDVPELLLDADVYVHTALWEGPPLPLAVLEAMACEKPVLINDCAGWPLGFEDGIHGFVTAAGDANALAQAMLKISKISPDDRKAMGRAARQLVIRCYDIKTIGSEFVSIVERVIKNEIKYRCLT